MAVYKADQENRGSMPYMTNDRGIVPPFITTKFQAIDNGILTLSLYIVKMVSLTVCCQ